jgi:hypothetical protein
MAQKPALVILLVGVAGLFLPDALAADRIASVDVDGTTFIVHLASGRVLKGKDLEGSTLTLEGASAATPRKVRIETVEVDPKDPDAEVLLYHMLAIDPDSGKTEELCGPDAEGNRWAFPVRGQWDSMGQHISDVGYTLTCGDGAQGKCVRFGYKPWKTLRDGTLLAAYHQACVRLVMADYCGGHGTTRNGVLIDIYDRIGIQQKDPAGEAAGVRFEAAWNARGAVCVAHTRVPENMSLASLAAECPRLAGRLGDKVCSEESAGGFGDAVLVFNRSR